MLGNECGFSNPKRCNKLMDLKKYGLKRDKLGKKIIQECALTRIVICNATKTIEICCILKKQENSWSTSKLT